MKKMWTGRFTKATAAGVDSFNSSLQFDKRLYEEDLKGSRAHVQVLKESGIISPEEAACLLEGLKSLERDIKEGKEDLRAEAEDIHTLLEKLLTERVGEVGQKLHTARSRNDQVALDMRLYIKKELKAIAGLLLNLQESLLAVAEKHVETIMPGYTHLQRAQPVTLAHHLLAYFFMLQRDFGRLENCYRQADVSPLGAGALAATTFSIDRELAARLLGLDGGITLNSIDAVSDRDFALEFLFFSAAVLIHLSRFSEELIIWSSQEFGFVEFDDAHAAGSSSMPQKKNPDIAELVRGKSGRVIGNLVSLLVVLKGLPLAYNKDLQEDKEAVFDSADTVKSCLEVFREILLGLHFNKEKMFAAACRGFTNATDAAEYLVKKGMTFREAHRLVGRIVLYCLQHKKHLDDLELAELQCFSLLFEKDIFSYISLPEALQRRQAPGGPAREAVREALNTARMLFKRNRENPVYKI